MKILYTILFIIDSLVLALLYYFFLKIAYRGHHPYKMTFDIAGIIICVFLLGYLIFKYSKLPPAHHNK